MNTKDSDNGFGLMRGLAVILSLGFRGFSLDAWRDIFNVGLVILACLWPAVFLLSWRDARCKPPLVTRSGVQRKVMPRRPIDYLTISIYYLLFLLLIWPGFIGDVYRQATG